jgi:hypothetical protein
LHGQIYHFFKIVTAFVDKHTDPLLCLACLEAQIGLLSIQLGLSAELGSLVGRIAVGLLQKLHQ